MVLNNTLSSELSFAQKQLKSEHFSFLTGKATKPVNIYLGHFGWNEKSFIGKVYPPKTQKSDFLSEYAQKYSAVLTTAGKRALPATAEIEKWIGDTPNGFKFSVLAPQYLTHCRNFNEDTVTKDLDNTLERLSLLGDKLAFIYFDFPAQVNRSRMDEMLTFITKIPHEFPLALSCRNVAIHNDSDIFNNILKTFAELNIATVLVDNKANYHKNLTLTNKDLIIHYHSTNSDEENDLAINNWTEKCAQYAENGIENIYFFATYPAPYKYKFQDIVNSFKRAIESKMGAATLFK